MNEERLIEIIKIAKELDWLQENPKGYSLMQLSEVEKCMLAMEDDLELGRMREWYNQEKAKNDLKKIKGEQKK